MATKDAAAAPPREKLLRRVVLRTASWISSRFLSICWVTYALGVLWVLLHPAVTVTTGELKPRGTYISENALLVDSIDAKASHYEETRVRSWHKSFISIPELPDRGCGQQGDCARVRDWLQTQLRSIDRVEAFSQRFTDASGHHRNGTNVYGILKAAPLADHKESIVLVTHYRNIGAGSSYSGITLGLALLEFLSAAKWLAKDVILVFADDGPMDGLDGFAPGTDAWLHAYHTDPLEQLPEHALPMRAGLIRAAINLETIGDLSKVDVVGVFTAGSNGQLPNLDLVNTAVSHTRQESVPVVLDRCLTVQQVLMDSQKGYQEVTCTDTLESLTTAVLAVVKRTLSRDHGHQVAEYVRNLYGMLRFMKTLATGPSGPHARFISYNIDAVTFALAQSVEPQHWQGAKSIRSVLRALELVVRSLSNLEEKLHQSFFLYVLPNNQHFVSVGEYYYTVALAVSPAIVHLLTMASKTASMRVALALAVVVALELVGLVLLVALSSSASASPSLVFFPVVVSALTVVQGLVVSVLVPWLRLCSVLRGNRDARAWRLTMQQFDASANAQTQPMTPPEIQDASSALAADPTGWRALKCALLMLIVFAHCILGILNYPMALFGGVVMAFFALVEPRQALCGQRPLKIALLTTWLVVSSPLGLFTILSLVDNAGTSAALPYFVASFASRINLLALPYACCVYLPIHSLALAVFVAPITSDASATPTEFKHSQMIQHK